MIKCIAVDDEPLALNLVRGFIERVPFLELIVTCESAYDAMSVLKSQKVDLMLLDINMPDMSGIQFVKTLSYPPAVILTTAYEQYALEGYELNVVDYLLKPFSFDRFLRAINKMNHLKNDTSVGQPLPSTNVSGEYMLVRVEHNIFKINLNDIHYIEGYKDYVKIYTATDKPILTLKSMKDLEDMLLDKGFMRVHRSFIVSLNKIDSLRNNRIMLKGKNIPIGETYRESFNTKFIDGKL